MFTVCSDYQFLVSILSGMTVVGSCLLQRSSESLHFKSSSVTLVLHTACSIKLYSSAAFRILRPQDLQTSSVRFSSLISGNPIEPQHSAKISPTLSSLPDGENRFSNDALPPPEVKFTPQNLQLLFFVNVYLWFSSSFTNLCGRC